jgi:hypothetical protein
MERSMKYCPVCSTSYDDESLNFCLKDGTPLEISGRAEGDTPTVVLGEQETIVRTSPVTPPPYVSTQPRKKSNTVLIVLLTVFILLFFLALAAAGLFYWQMRSGQTANNSNQKISPSPTPSVKPSPTASPTASPARSPVSDDELDQVKDDVKKKLELWKSLGEARDLESNLKNYADHVDYYNAKNVTRDFIAKDKRRASEIYDTFNIDLKNINITPDPGGDKATVVFDKEWEFSGPEKSSSGKVQQQLKLEKISGEWLITSEKDLKLYYKN